MNLNRLISERKWAFALISLVLFINPLFIFWATDREPSEKILTWVICIVLALAMSSLDLFLKKKGEKIYLSLIFLLSIIPNIVVWSYLYLSKLYMKRDMFWVIFNSHPSESQEFIQQFIPWQIILMSVLYIGLGIFFIIKAQSQNALSVKKNAVLFSFSLLILLICPILQYTSQAVPTFEFYKSRILFWAENQKFEREKELRKQLTIDVECTLPDSTQHVFVVLIGESTSSCHMSLYGYFRETTPLMDAQKAELDIYTDVITPDTHTFGVMQKVLTFANHQHPEYYKEKASIVELFNAAGFDTHWISNKSFITKWGGSYGVIADQAQHIYDLSIYKKPDEIVLTPLKEILNDGSTNNKIIFVHVMGNHSKYKSRYPESFEHFNHKTNQDLDDLGFRNTDMKQTIDEYDNSILYGDFVYDSILKELKKHDEVSSFFLFFADHGDEVFDTRDASGHLMSNVFPCQSQIPFVLWRSEKFKAESPNIIIETERPYSIEDIIHSISTLSQLEYDDYEPSLSIFSDEYKESDIRLVGKEDYNDILEKVK